MSYIRIAGSDKDIKNNIMSIEEIVDILPITKVRGFSFTVNDLPHNAETHPQH